MAASDALWKRDARKCSAMRTTGQLGSAAAQAYTAQHCACDVSEACNRGARKTRELPSEG